MESSLNCVGVVTYTISKEGLLFTYLVKIKYELFVDLIVFSKELDSAMNDLGFK